MKKPDGYYTFDGKKYPYKEYNGYRFSIEPLQEVLMNEEYEPVSDEAYEIDSQIAYFFDEESFNELTSKQLYKEYDLHS